MSGQGSYKSRKPKLGLICMDKKAKSEHMKALLYKLNHDNYLEIIEFSEALLLNEDIDKWPSVDVIIGFHSKGFPLKKAIAYERQHRRALTINSLNDQRVLLSRFDVYRRMDQHSIPTCPHILLERESPPPEKYCEACKAIILKTGNPEMRADSICCTCEYKDPLGLIDEGEYIEYEGTRIYRPFVEKPKDSEDHNIWIYYPSVKGPATETGEGPSCEHQEGVTKLFRKVDNKSSVFIPGSFPIRHNGSYVYEAFLQPEGNTDVKIYAIFPNYILAEKRKAPHIDGVVERDPETQKEVREPTELTSKERDISNLIWRAFKQRVCGYDFIRSGNKSYVCDVNGWSFVKSNSHYYDNCARILRELIHQVINIDQRALTVTYGLQLEEYCSRKYEYNSTATNIGEYTYRDGKKYYIDDGYLKVLANKKGSQCNHRFFPCAINKESVQPNTLIGNEPLNANLTPALPASKASELSSVDSKISLSLGSYTGCTLKQRGLVSILRHGDRAPKFKYKITSSNHTLFKIFAGILDRDVEIKKYNRREEELRDIVLRPEYSVGRAEEIAATIGALLKEMNYDLEELRNSPPFMHTEDPDGISSSSEPEDTPKDFHYSVKGHLQRHLKTIYDGIAVKFSSLCAVRSLAHCRRTTTEPSSGGEGESAEISVDSDAVFFPTEEIDALKLTYSLLTNEIAGTKVQLRLVKKTPFAFQMIIKWGGYLSIAGLRQSFSMGKQIRKMFLTYFDDPSTYFRDPAPNTSQLLGSTSFSSPVAKNPSTHDEETSKDTQSLMQERRSRMFSQILHVFYGNERRVRKTAIGVLLGICADIEAEIDDILPTLSNYNSYELAPNALKMLRKLYDNRPIPYVHLYPSQLSQILVEGGDILESKSKLVTSAIRAEQRKINDILNRTVSSLDKSIPKIVGSAVSTEKSIHEATLTIPSFQEAIHKRQLSCCSDPAPTSCCDSNSDSYQSKNPLLCESSPTLINFSNTSHIPDHVNHFFADLTDSSKTFDLSEVMRNRTHVSSSSTFAKPRISTVFPNVTRSSTISKNKEETTGLIAVHSQPDLEAACFEQNNIQSTTEFDTNIEISSTQTDLLPLHTRTDESVSSEKGTTTIPLTLDIGKDCDLSLHSTKIQKQSPENLTLYNNTTAFYSASSSHNSSNIVTKGICDKNRGKLSDTPASTDIKKYVPEKYVSIVMQAFRGCLWPTSFALHRDAASSIYTSLKAFIDEAQALLETEGTSSGAPFNLSRLYRDFGDDIYMQSSTDLKACIAASKNVSFDEQSFAIDSTLILQDSAKPLEDSGLIPEHQNSDKKKSTSLSTNTPLSNVSILPQLSFVLKSMAKGTSYDFSKLVDIYHCLRFLSIHCDKLARLPRFSTLYKHVELYAQNLAYYSYGIQELDRNKIAYSIGGMLLDAVVGDLIQYASRLKDQQSQSHKKGLLVDITTGPGITDTSPDMQGCYSQQPMAFPDCSTQRLTPSGERANNGKDDDGSPEEGMLAEIYIGGEAYLHATINLLLSQDYLLPFLAKERHAIHNISYLANVHFVLWELYKPGMDPAYLVETFFSPGTTSDIFQPNTHNTQPIDQPETLIHPIPLRFLNGLVSKSIRQAQQKKTSERLLSTVCVLRHADRTPKQRLKFRVQDEQLVAAIMKDLSSSPIAPKDVTLWSANDADKRLIKNISRTMDIYVSKLSTLLGCRDAKISAQKLESTSAEADPTTEKARILYLNLVDLLTIMRSNPPALKIQVKFPVPWKGVKEFTLIAKYGGLLTKMGRVQSRQCGQQIFQMLVDDVLDNEESNQVDNDRLDYLKFLISTCKIYCNDEPRVRETAEACVSHIVECWNTHLARDNKEGIIHWDKNSVKELIMLSEVDKYARSLIDDQKRSLNEALTSNVNLSNVNPSTLPPTLCTLLRNIPTITQVELQVPSIRLEALKDLLFKLISGYEEFFAAQKANKATSTGSAEDIGQDSETPEIILLRMRSIAESFYRSKDDSYDVSKISDIVDLLRYEVLQRRAILTTEIQNVLKQAWDAAKILAKVTVHQEFGLADLWKFAIASLICKDLLTNIIEDLKSPGLLFYFTSESHLHGLLNLLLCSPSSKCQMQRDSVSSVDFLSHFIFKAYTDSNDKKCSRIEVYWSRGSAHSPYKLDTTSSESVLRVQEPILISDILIPSDLQDMLDSSKDIIDLIKARDADLIPLLPTK